MSYPIVCALHWIVLALVYCSKVCYYYENKIKIMVEECIIKVLVHCEILAKRQ